MNATRTSRRTGQSIRAVVAGLLVSKLAQARRAAQERLA